MRRTHGLTQMGERGGCQPCEVEHGLVRCAQPCPCRDAVAIWAGAVEQDAMHHAEPECAAAVGLFAHVG